MSRRLCWLISLCELSLKRELGLTQERLKIDSSDEKQKYKSVSERAKFNVPTREMYFYTEPYTIMDFFSKGMRCRQHRHIIRTFRAKPCYINSNTLSSTWQWFSLVCSSSIWINISIIKNIPFHSLSLQLSGLKIPSDFKIKY